VPAFAKTVFKKVYNIALFTPLNIDQVVTDTTFSVTNRTPLPPATLSGLEFYEGALLAMDSLQQEGIPIRLTIYDTKSTSKPLVTILQGTQLDSTDLIIGNVNGNELKAISNFAKGKEINFISATFPNDAGISENPFLTILNSTLSVHCRAIQNFAQQKFSDKNILVIYQDNAQEKQNLNYMQLAYREMNYSFKTPLQPLEWGSNTTVSDLLPYLKKDKNNVIIITSLYPQVALNIIGQLIPLTKTYTLNVVGMPTLDGDQDLKNNEYSGINIYYSTPYPYYRASDNSAIRSMMWQFFGKYRSRPSDMALKGYETLFYFGHLLHKEGVYFNKNINDPQGRIYTQFNIQPVYENN
ncbi:MAG: ABC transporter substrate-binding protein, partial [Chitinophagaceae bacterium]